MFKGGFLLSLADFDDIYQICCDEKEDKETHTHRIILLKKILLESEKNEKEILNEIKQVIST
jgi:hypothetical protein